MINVHLQGFVLALQGIRNMALAFKREQEDQALSGSDTEAFRAIFALTKGNCTALKLERANSVIMHIEMLVRTGRSTYGRLSTELDVLHRAIVDDSAEAYFFRYEREKARLVMSTHEEWKRVFSAFPATWKDIASAVDCYALGHHRASIYHCMMILEVGLPAFAQSVGIKVNRNKATWGPIIGDIQARIDSRRRVLGQPRPGSPARAPRAAAVEKRRLDAFEQVAIEFKYFTNMWRNHIAHGRGDYDEDDSRKALEHVREFMINLAKVIRRKNVS